LLSITAPNFGAVQPQPELWAGGAALALVGTGTGALVAPGEGALAGAGVGAGVGAGACTGIGRWAEGADSVLVAAVVAGNTARARGAEAVARLGGAARATGGGDGCWARLKGVGGRVALTLGEPATNSGAARG
jgi:hypothetical protein